ncbi:hypothetical protein BDF22DRAFT_699792 [Syncephalis plumigaleata]|nr:hypothetical protein BDF22DRAFT_699792 [Syncephalis plumigaleata]
MSTELKSNDTEDHSITHLVADLYKHFLSADGTRRELAEQVKRGRHILQRYQQTKLFYNALLNTQQTSWLESVRQRLITRECEDYRLIDDDDASTSRQVGEDTDRSIRPLGVLPSDPLVEHDLRQMEMKIELEGRLEQCGIHCKQLKREIDDMQMQLITERMACIKLEEETVSYIISSMNNVHGIESIAEYTSYLAGIADNLKRKLNTQHAEILRQIYSGKTPDALPCDSVQQMLEELNEANAQLHEYQSAGSEYITIATEYGEVLDAIKEVKEDLERMKTSA